MSSHQRPTSGASRRHGRNISHPLQRKTTNGPLDGDDDPLAESAASVSPPSPKSKEPSPPLVAIRQSLPPSPLDEPTSKPLPNQAISLRFLQDRGIYHALSTTDIAFPFLDSEHQPPLATPLQDLIKHGHFRRAAEVAVDELLQSRPEAVETIFPLLYTRLACLVLISRPDLAAQEAFPLTDVLARNTLGASDLLPLVPWELRLLIVRLQSIGAADGGRRGIMALYALTAEVRVQLKASLDQEDEAAAQTWAGRLKDLGFRAADTLVEMGELETAYRHLETLQNADTTEINYRKALLRLRVGDTQGAKFVIGNSKDGKLAPLAALIGVAEGDLKSASRAWKSSEGYGEIEADLFAQNLAVCLLYAGRIEQARRVLEELNQHSSPFSALLFNLSTVYELCTERAADLKMALVMETARKSPMSTSEGWERANAEFKL